jgi:hypothetical protein
MSCPRLNGGRLKMREQIPDEQTFLARPGPGAHLNQYGLLLRRGDNDRFVCGWIRLETYQRRFWKCHNRKNNISLGRPTFSHSYF